MDFGSPIGDSPCWNLLPKGHRLVTENSLAMLIPLLTLPLCVDLRQMFLTRAPANSSGAPGECREEVEKGHGGKGAGRRIKRGRSKVRSGKMVPASGSFELAKGILRFIEAMTLGFEPFALNYAIRVHEN